MRPEKFHCRTVPVRGLAPTGDEVDIMVEADEIPVIEAMLGRRLDWTEAEPFAHADAYGVGSLAFVIPEVK